MLLFMSTPIDGGINKLPDDVEADMKREHLYLALQNMHGYYNSNKDFDYKDSFGQDKTFAME